MTTLQGEILSQLSELNRTAGTLVGQVESLKEDVRTQGHETAQYRDTITSGLNNALTRIGALEQEIKGIKQVVEKTLKPLASGALNMRQRIIGFVAAWSIFAAGIGVLIWFFTTGWGTLSKLFGALH